MDGTKLSKLPLRAMLCFRPRWGEMRGFVAMKKVGETTRSQSDFSEGQKGPYGRSPKKPTVGFEDDLPWVVSTTYSRFFSAPSESPPPRPKRIGGVCTLYRLANVAENSENCSPKRPV